MKKLMVANNAIKIAVERYLDFMKGITKRKRIE